MNSKVQFAIEGEKLNLFISILEYKINNLIMDITKPEEQKVIQRQRCQIYSRCMWYMRPVANYNIGKKTEFYSRKYFTEEKVDARKNRGFNQQYGDDSK